jgi:hypothetical protein
MVQSMFKCCVENCLELLLKKKKKKVTLSSHRHLVIDMAMRPMTTWEMMSLGLNKDSIIVGNGLGASNS